MTITVQIIIAARSINAVVPVEQISVSELARRNGVAAAEFKVNSAEVDGDTVLNHADVVEIFPIAAPVVVATRLVDVGDAPPRGADAVRVLFINNDGTGFGNYVVAPANQTIAEFLASYGIDTAGKNIRVNAQPVAASYRLLTGDKISVTPTKIEGAARVLFIDNGKDGFANYLDVIDGTTIGQFLSQRTGGEAPTGFNIRVNSQSVARDYQLRGGDKVTITPSKIEGAR